MLIMNLAASFLCDKFPEQLVYIFEHADVVFGNEHVSIANIAQVNTSMFFHTYNKYLEDHSEGIFHSKSILFDILTIFPNSFYCPIYCEDH